MGCMLASAQDAADLASQWKAAGRYFSWKSTLPENHEKSTQIFYTCSGDESKPAMLMVHGFPTSTFDFRLLADELKTDFRICLLDFPGYGFSDKPAAPYRYSLKDDAQLLWHFVTKVVPMREFALLSHDRGDSVSLSFLSLYQEASQKPFTITHQYILNGNVLSSARESDRFPETDARSGDESGSCESRDARAARRRLGIVDLYARAQT